MRDNFVGSLNGGPAEVSVREGLPGQEGRGLTHLAIESPSYGRGGMGGENNDVSSRKMVGGAIFQLGGLCGVGHCTQPTVVSHT